MRVVYADELGKKLGTHENEESDLKSVMGYSLYSETAKNEADSPAKISRKKLTSESERITGLEPLRLRSNNSFKPKVYTNIRNRYENADEVNLEDEEHFSSGQK